MARPPLDDNYFDELLEPETVRIVVPMLEGDTSEMLQDNLRLALQKQHEILGHPVDIAVDPAGARIVAETAHNVVRAAVAVDANRLRQRKDDFFIRLLRAIAREKNAMALDLTEAERRALADD